MDVGPAAPVRKDIRTTRGLALALPIEPGEHVVVVGEGHLSLARSLASTGARATVLCGKDDVSGLRPRIDARATEPGEAWPIAGPADHAIVSSRSPGWLETSGRELRRLVRPGGHVLIACPATPPSRRRLDALLRDLQSGGFRVDARYGVRQDLHDVRHLVPISGPALWWYLRNSFLPWSRRAALLAALFGRIHASRLARRAFPAVATVLTRTRTGDSVC